jgi:hypothetical protein
MHNHCHCEHDLKYCEKCDVVYCTKCGKEWTWCSTWTHMDYPPFGTITFGGTADTVPSNYKFMAHSHTG